MIPTALSLYAATPVGVRAHVWGRWATCPFDRVADRVPKEGRILEVGCGYGVLSVHLATTSAGRDVLGIDVDVRKIVHAQYVAERARARGHRCEFHLSPPGEIPDGPWDAIVICDVLYLLDADAQEGLLATCTEQLALGGSLVVKEMATSPTWKARWNRVQETLAVRVLKITAGEELTFLDPSALGAWMERSGLVVTHEPLDRGYLHPHHLIVGTRRRAIDGGASD